MTDAEVILSQARKLEALEVELAERRERMHKATMLIVCVGGPLNDDKYGCSREIRLLFHRILDEVGYD